MADIPSDLRGYRGLAHLRGRKPCVVICRGHPSVIESAQEELAGLGAEVVIERHPGPLSALLGRPSITVCDRFLDVELHGDHMPLDEVLRTIAWLQMRCEECPQSAEELA